MSARNSSFLWMFTNLKTSLSAIMQRVVGKILFICMVVFASNAAAQSYGYDTDYYDDSLSEEYAPVITTDTTLFYRAIRVSEDLFSSVVDYAFPSAGLSRRGVGYHEREIAYAGLLLPVRHISSFTALRAERRRVTASDIASWRGRNLAGVDEFSFPLFHRVARTIVGANFADKGYNMALRGYTSHEFGRGWSIDASLDVRTGRDLYADGVFRNSANIGLHLAKRWSDDESLSLLLTFAPSMRGLRSSSSDEAFALTGDNLYNPSWGWHEGKQRNSRVRRDMMPLSVVSYRRDIGVNTTFDAAISIEAGKTRNSNLGWYDARTPMPDNYRYMPSYIADATSSQMVADAWRAGDSRYTQIDWAELYAVNDMADGEAVYAVEDRVRRIVDLGAAARFRTTIRDNLWLDYGLSARVSLTRNYRQMRDLLGADHLTDIDLYLIDDDTYSNLLQNDLRHPDRKVYEGDRFGYDYALRHESLGVMVGLEYRAGFFDICFAATLGEEWMSRRGYYEKELFPMGGSYGNSPRINLTTHHLALALGYAFTPRHYLGVNLAWMGDVPEAETLFWNPNYNNRLVDNPTTEKRVAMEVTYRSNLGFMQLQGSLFAHSTGDAMDGFRYYDDLAGEYVDSHISGISRICYGAELAADIEITRYWRAEVAATAMRHRYSKNPMVKILSDASNSVVDSGSESHMGDCEVGGTPRFAATASINYFSRKWWGVEISTSWLGGRYVEASMVRRTERVARQAATSPESFRTIVEQRRLGDCYDLSLVVSKMWRMRNDSRIRVMMSVRNILNKRDMVVTAYESDRVRAVWQGATTTYEPLPTRLTYAYPRTFYLSATYTF